MARNIRRKKFCRFSAEGEHRSIIKIGFIKRYITETGKIVPSRITETSAKYQRQLCVQLSELVFIALLPFCDAHK